MKADRVIILASLVLLHGIAVVFLVRQRIAMRQEREVTVFVAPITLDKPQSARPAPAGRRHAVHSSPVATPSFSAPSPEPSTTAPLNLPDWAATADAVVRDHTAAEAERDRQAQALSSRNKPLPASPTPAFHWDQSVTERVVELPRGGKLIRLNENCVLVVQPMPSGGCALGKSRAHGDLFDHLHDPPGLGDKLDSAVP